jgi:hypothetical protein
MRRRSQVAALVALLGVAGAARAQQKSEKLVIAIYAPNAPFDSGEARYSFTACVARQITKATGVTAEPKAYARASDFEAAVKKGQVDFSVLDGVYLAERGTPYSVLAIATSSGEPATRWWLLSTEQVSLLELQGKRLAHAATTGRDASFIENALLEGEVPKLFSARQATPDVASAVTAVTLHKADAVFAPEGASKGLKRVFDAGRVPNPAFVVTRASLDADLVAKVKSAVLGASHCGGAFDGWKGGSADPYRVLAGRLGARTRRPLMAEPVALGIDPTEALVLPPLDPATPDPKGEYWMPTGLP